MQRNYFFCGQLYMKHSLLIVIAVLSLFISCKKGNDNSYICKEPQVCAAVVCVAYWSYLNFTITDKATGKDLLFGSNPKLTAADIKLYMKQNSPYTEVPVLVDNDKKRLFTLRAADTMALQIKNEPLQYLLVKNFCGDECCSRTAVEIVQEGKLLIADEQKLIRFKY
jgi:glutaredoxin